MRSNGPSALYVRPIPLTVHRSAARSSCRAVANIGGQKIHLGTEAVLSRWNVQYCANCQTHLEVQAYFGVPASPRPARA